MKTSSQRILTTHVGSLARPLEQHELLEAQKKGAVDAAEFDAATRKAVERAVHLQAEAGISVISDGEQSKASFSTYVRQRLTGLGEEQLEMPITLDEREFPNWGNRRRRLSPCIGPVEWQDFAAVEKDVVNLKEAAESVPHEDVFMPAVSPGTMANFFPNRYYSDRQAYLDALSDTLSREYRAIVDAGIVLQVDCPDLALQNYWFPDHTLEEFREVIAGNVEALNRALDGISPSQVRLHVCWGAGESPKNHDVPLRSIIDIVLRASVGALSFVGANGRHEHEYAVWREIDLPDNLVLIPGVIDNTTNIVEHPDWVAERIVRYARIVGRERVIAGVDCGFGTGSSATPNVDPAIAIAKLKALSEGARRASAELW